MWWRRSWFSLKGKVGIHDQARAAPLRHPASQHQPAHPCTTAPRTCRRAAPCTTTSTDGTTTARSGAFTTRSMWHAGSWRGGTPARALRSLIARASRAQKKGRRIDPPGYDGGKKIRGKKRHVLVDTQGLLLQAIVHAADIQDREGGVLLMATLFGLYPFLLKLYADGGYQGPQFQGGLRRIMRHVDVEIVKRSDAAKGFTVLPRRWIVERTIAWLNRCRRLAKDWECLNHKALAFLRLASIRLMLRKLCQASK